MRTSAILGLSSGLVASIAAALSVHYGEGAMGALVAGTVCWITTMTIAGSLEIWGKNDR